MRIPYKTFIGAAALLGGYWILNAAGATTGQGSVRLSWVASTSSDVVGYHLYYGAASHPYTDAVSVGNTTNATLGGLDVGTTYYFAARAYDSSGNESDDSNEISYLVPASARPPSGGGGSYPSAGGSYSGLFFETNQDQVQVWSAGCFQVLVTPRGAYSGRLQIGSTHYSFSGNFDSQGQAAGPIFRRTPPAMALTLSLGPGNQANQITGTLSDGTWSANLSGARAVFNARSNPAPFAGRYTLVFPGQTGSPSLPAGNGFGTARVLSNGQALFAGKLADGTAVSQSASISEDGAWPLYVSPYSGKGLVLGTLDLLSAPGQDVAGTVTWIKSAGTTSRYYPAGFTNEVQVLGSAYVRPAGPAGAILSLTNATVTFSGGDFSAAFANSIELGLSSRVTNLGSDPLNMSFSLTTGAFSGNVRDTASGKGMPFSGVVLQKLKSGYGLVLGTDQTSQVVIGP